METWQRLVAEGTRRPFRPGEILLHQGGPPSHVLLLTSGRVKVLLTLPDGKVLLLAVRGPGELLGEIAVLGGDGRSATVVALDPCVTHILAAERFRVLMRSAGLEGELLRNAMRRIREGEVWRAETALLAAGPRVAQALVRLALPHADGSASVGLGQAEIGQMVGLARSVVADQLARLREQQIVVTGRRQIIITNLPRLRALAESEGGSV